MLKNIWLMPLCNNIDPAEAVKHAINCQALNTD